MPYKCHRNHAGTRSRMDLRRKTEPSKPNADMPDSPIERRKTEHIRICLEKDVTGRGVTNGLERYRFRHEALPEMDFLEIRTDSTLWGKTLRAPFLISSMTGGSEAGRQINERLARLAQKRGWALAVGSLRAAVEHPQLTPTFEVRRYAPDIPVIANIGAVQLNYGFGVEECRRAVELIGADALVLHVNGLQEVFQPGGNTNFKGLLEQIARLCAAMPDIPVGVKEVGWGISGIAAAQLAASGARFIDVAGAGGTSWSQVEKYRSSDGLRRQAAEAFADWGIPTADCVREVRSALPAIGLFASGGLTDGVEAAKALALGADLAGFAKTLLAAAVESPQALEELGERLELELRAAMFGIGAGTLEALRGTASLVPAP